MRHLFHFSNGTFDFRPDKRCFVAGDDAGRGVNCGHPYLESTLTAVESQEMHARVQIQLDLLLARPWLLLDCLPARLQPVGREISQYFQQMFTDEETRAYVIFALSMCLTGNNEVAHLLNGRGCNGKTDFLEKLLPLLFGDYHCTMGAQLWTSPAPASKFLTASLKDKRCATAELSASTTKAKVVLREHAVKAFVGNTDVAIQAREPYSRTVQVFVSQFASFLSTNNNVQPENDSLRHRLRYIPLFTHFYPHMPMRRSDGSLFGFPQFRRDATLPERMRAWPVPLLWLLVQAQLLLPNGKLPDVSETRFAQVFHFTERKFAELT